MEKNFGEKMFRTVFISTAIPNAGLFSVVHIWPIYKIFKRTFYNRIQLVEKINATSLNKIKIYKGKAV